MSNGDESPTEDDNVEISMKSAILSSDEYSSSSSETEEETAVSNKWRKYTEDAMPIGCRVIHRPPKPPFLKNSPKITIVEGRGTPREDCKSDINCADLSSSAMSSVLSSDEYSSESSEEDNQSAREERKVESDFIKRTAPTVAALSKKRVSFGNIVDTYWEEHWDKFWKTTAENKTDASVVEAELPLDEDVNSQNFSPILASTQKEDDDKSDGLDAITTSTPFSVMTSRNIPGVSCSSSSEDFSQIDSNNSSGNSTQEAVLRAIAVLERSEGSQENSLKIQSVTQESLHSSLQSGSTHTSEWESDGITSGSDTSSKEIQNYRLTDITKAQSIEEIAKIITRTCIKEALETVLSTKTPIHQGRMFLSPPGAYSLSPLVTISGYLCETPAPVVNLSARLCEQVMGDSYNQTLDDTDVYLRVKSTSGNDQIVPCEIDKFSPTDVKDEEMHKNEGTKFQTRIQVAPSDNLNMIDWDNKFFAQIEEDNGFMQTQELGYVATKSVVKPTEFERHLPIIYLPFVRQDATAVISTSVSAEGGWCQRTYFSDVATPTPKRRRRSFFPDLIGDEQEQQLPEESIPKTRYFKSPNAPELIPDFIPESCSRVDAIEKLPMLHSLSTSPPKFVYSHNCTKSCPGDCPSPIIPVMRGKLSTVIDVLQDSPESGRCSKESDHSDAKSVESTPISTHDSTSSDEYGLPQDSRSNSPDSINSRCTDDSQSKKDHSSPTYENIETVASFENVSPHDKKDAENENDAISSDDPDAQTETRTASDSGTDGSLEDRDSEHDLSVILAFKEMEPPISDLESSQSSIPAVINLNTVEPRTDSQSLSDRVPEDKQRRDTNPITLTRKPEVTDIDVTEDCISIDAEGTITDKSFNDENEDENREDEETGEDHILNASEMDETTDGETNGLNLSTHDVSEKTECNISRQEDDQNKSSNDTSLSDSEHADTHHVSTDKTAEDGDDEMADECSENNRDDEGYSDEGADMNNSQLCGSEDDGGIESSDENEEMPAEPYNDAVEETADEAEDDHGDSAGSSNELEESSADVHEDAEDGVAEDSLTEGGDEISEEEIENAGHDLEDSWETLSEESGLEQNLFEDEQAEHTTDTDAVINRR